MNRQRGPYVGHATGNQPGVLFLQQIFEATRKLHLIQLSRPVASQFPIQRLGEARQDNLNYLFTHQSAFLCEGAIAPARGSNPDEEESPGNRHSRWNSTPPTYRGQKIANRRTGETPKSPESLSERMYPDCRTLVLSIIKPGWLSGVGGQKRAS